MSTQMIRQTTFTTGEVDTSTWKRTDVDVYISAAQRLLNIEVGTTGLAKKRKGTEMMLDVSTLASVNTKMYDFVDRFDNHYILLSANLTFYVFKVLSSTADVVNYTPAHVVNDFDNQVVAYNNKLEYYLTSMVTPYAGVNLDELDYTQDNDSIIFTHPDFPPARVYISNYSPITFTYEVLDIYPLPAYDFNKINYNSAIVSALSVFGSTLTITLTGLPASPQFTNAWIGGQIIGGGASDIDPIGYAIIEEVASSAGTTTFTANVQVPFKTTDYATSGAQYSIRQPAWSEALGYPGKVLYYQNRLWFGGTNSLPATIFGSKINAPINFDVGTGRDVEAIVYTIGQTNTGKIRWLNGGKQLEIFTENYEFACPQDANSALTPSSFSIRQQSSYGASNTLKPLTYINDSYFCTKTGKSLANYHFTGVGLAYNASNISAASSHLVKNPNNRALLRGSDSSQDNFIYFLNQSDNSITAFQFAIEYKLAALTPIHFQKDVTLIDIVSSDNQVYILKRYDLTNTYTIEKMMPDVKIDSFRRGEMSKTGVITGLEKLAGYTVQVVYKNQDYGQAIVKEDGTIQISNVSKTADTVMIGLLYDVDITPMYLFAGTASSPFMKQMTRIYVDYENSLDFRINGKLVPYQEFTDIQEKLPLIPRTGTAVIAPVSGWKRFDTFSITQSSPFDLQITAIGYQISTAMI